MELLTADERCWDLKAVEADESESGMWWGGVHNSSMKKLKAEKDILKEAAARWQAHDESVCMPEEWITGNNNIVI